MTTDDTTGTEAFALLLSRPEVRDAAIQLATADEADLSALLALARNLSLAADDGARAGALGAELNGYEGSGLEIPSRRRVSGHASPFPVRAIGLLEPEEIFLANREKFAQVTLTIGQPVRELITALDQIQEGGVLALRVPASEVSGEAIAHDPDSEVYIYILPREIERVVDGARRMASDALVTRLVEGILGGAEVTRLRETNPPVEIDEVESGDIEPN